MRTVEVPFAAAVEAEKNRYIQDAAQAFPITLRLSDVAFDLHNANMAAIAERYDMIAVRLALDEMAEGIKSALPVATKKWDSLWFYLVRQWVHEFGAARARETATTTRADLQRVIDRALAPDEEFNPQQVANGLLRVMGLSAWRAATVARTETHAAMMYASEAGAAKLGMDQQVTILKSWLPVQDERTRVNHASMSSHAAIPLDADFNVGGVPMKRPGDPRGGAANCVNCRCVLTYSVQE